MATAFLMNGDRLLMIKRSPNASLFPDRWTPIGGHLEAAELNDPHAACLREIREETGLREEHLVKLALRYVVHRRKDDEIRTQYVYFSVATKECVSKTDEGELSWIQFDRVLDLDISATTRFTLEHYKDIGSQSECVYVGAVDDRDGKPIINWAVLRDWE
jgi:8-oxo-dGTP diphosphatase